MICPICRESSVDLKATPKPYTFYRCRACGVYFADPRPKPEQTGELHTDAYYAGGARPDEDVHEAASNEVAAYRSRELLELLGRPGRLLDVGCGTGFFLAAARDVGWQVQGVEPSAAAANHASAVFGVPVWEGFLEEAQFPDGSFDVITLIHVLEHLPDPRSLIKESRRLLAPGGILRIAVPNARGLLYAAYNIVHRLRGRYGRTKFSCSLFPPFHVFAWDAGSLRTLLEMEGFAIQRMFTVGKGDARYYAVADWRATGRHWRMTAGIERVGAVLGRGTLLEASAKKALGE
ncbi:MAG: class I SAM-dependent methyltransferase [Actinomycetota bacterium]